MVLPGGRGNSGLRTRTGGSRGCAGQEVLQFAFQARQPRVDHGEREAEPGRHGLGLGIQGRVAGLGRHGHPPSWCPK